MRIKSSLGIALALFISGGATYAYELVPQVLPQSLRKIAVRQFANKSNRPGLEQKLTMTVHEAFVRDGRWEIVEEAQAEGVVIGEITRYMLMPLKHGATGSATEYKLWVLVDVSFYDVNQKKTLWTERNLEATLTAPPSSSGLPGATTEVEAQQKLWDQLAKDIATRTFEGFGSVTGISDKAVPQSSPGEKIPGAR